MPGGLPRGRVYVAAIVNRTRRSLFLRLPSLLRERPTAQVLVAVAGGAVVVGVGVGLILVGVLNLRSSAAATLRSGMLLERVLQVERSVVDAETGVRGYVITNSGQFLGPLRAARSVLPGETASLVREARRDHEHVTAARALASSAQRFIADYLPPVLAMMRTDPANARSLAVTLAGKRRVDTVRSQASALEHALSAEQASRADASNSTASRDITFGVIILVALVLLTVAIEGILGRLLLARNNALGRSRENARMLQTSLLPLAIPEIPNCELAIRFTPAGAGSLVGGDFYDVFELDTPKHWAVVVGDVCGKGAEAAATTAVARWTLRSASRLGLGPAEALAHLNDVMLRRRQRFLFATIAYLRCEIDTDEMRITVACAGHPAPIVLSGAEPPAPVAAHGDLVGIFAQLRLQTSHVRLAPGDLVVAFTDGATDFAPGPIDPLELFLRDADPTDAAAVAASIEARALAGRPNPRDDIAVVAIGFRGGVGDGRAADAETLAQPAAQGASPPAAPTGGGHGGGPGTAEAHGVPGRSRARRSGVRAAVRDEERPGVRAKRRG